jgi:gliding motility-associated-like protein
MQRKLYSIIVALIASIFVLGPLKVFSQPLVCPPYIDWETGDTTGWTAQWGDYPANGAQDGVPPFPGGVPQTTILTPNNGFVAGRHDIMSLSLGLDPFGLFPVVSPLGGQFAIRLSNQVSGGDGDRIRFKFTIPATINNYSIRFLYAVVLQDPGTSHSPEQKPRFTVTVRDSATGLPFRDGCSDLNFIAAPDIPGFLTSTVQQDVVYKPWTQHVVNLSGAAGKTVFLEITAGDCSLSGHFGYGYFDVMNCEEYNVTIAGDSCNLDRGGVSLHGPIGFMTYEWYDENWNLVDTGEYVTLLPKSTTPGIFRLIATPFPSVSLCKDTLQTIPFANINIDKIDTSCMEPNIPLLLDANIYGGAGPLTYQWSETSPSSTLSSNSIAAPVATSPISNRYTVIVTDTAGCHKSEFMTIGINENKVQAMPDFVQCRPGFVEINAEPVGPAPRTVVDCDTTSLASLCATPNVITVGTEYRNTFESREDTSTLNNPFAAQYTSARMQFIIRKEDLYAAGLKHGTLSSLGFEVKNPHSASLNTFSISLACTEQGSLGGAFVQNTRRVYTSPGALVPVVGWNDFTFDKPYNWDMTKNLVVDICFHNPTKDTAPVVMVVNTGSADALVGYTVSNNGNVCANAKTDDIVIYNGRPIVRMGYCPSPDAPFQYVWEPGTFLQDSTIKSPLAYINKSVSYVVNTEGGSYCPVKDTLNIIVPIHDYDVYPKDTVVCYGESFKMWANGSPTSVQWYEYVPSSNSFVKPNNFVCDGCPDATQSRIPVVSKPTDTAIYAVEYTDQYGCKDTFLVNVYVKPLPIVNILNQDTTIKYGKSLQLLVSGAYLYTWSPVSSLSNPNLTHPWASPTEPTTYYVWGLGENGCRNIDSVKINIDYRDNLFVPSAFTPNGDGKNDVFRVSNITFQKLQEFRVFNRWGQEIFSTTDPQKGWDGSWKGVPQDMGVYQYLIKVAYPDGYIETYKGDVSLIR